MQLRESAAASPFPRTAERLALRRTRPVKSLAAIALGILALSAVVSVTQGAVRIPALTVLEMFLYQVPLAGDWLGITQHWPASYEGVVFQIRLPRVALAVIVGAALAISGATYQGLFRNPLADPYLIGVSPGASLGAVIALLLPLSPALYGLGLVQWSAFAGALLTVSIVYLLARVGRTTPVTTLLLAGAALGAFASSITSFLMYMHQDKLSVTYSWLLGGLSLGSWRQVIVVVPYVVIGFVAICLHGRLINVLQLDEEQAAQLGIHVERVKLILVAAATLNAAAAVSVSGLIGFVGLIVPHLVRLIWGADYRLILPLSTLVGAVFLLWADTLSRTFFGASEIPVGVITAFCGAPFFLYLLRQRKRLVF